MEDLISRGPTVEEAREVKEKSTEVFSQAAFTSVIPMIHFLA